MSDLEQGSSSLRAVEVGLEVLNQDKRHRLNLCFAHGHPMGLKVRVTIGFDVSQQLE